MRVLPLVGIALIGVACAEPERSEAPPPASSVFSADAGAGLSVVERLDGGPVVPKQPEPGVLAEIIAAAPKALPKTTDPDGGTLVGTETGAEPEGGAAISLSAKGSPRRVKRGDKSTIESGKIEVQALPDHASERLARAQIYYPLVMRCRDAEGRILPPDAILLSFRIDEEGNIVPSLISAIAEDPRYESAANCMRRELSALAFRGPAAVRGSPITLRATIPSVD